MKNRGFTLIELLTVIAIIAVVSALGFTGMARAREAAKNATCLGNLRQIGAGLMTYAADHRGHITGRTHAVEFKSDGTPTYAHWYRRLGREGYVSKTNAYGDSPIFYCPLAAPKAPDDDEIDDPLNTMHRYGMRNWTPPGAGIALNDETRLLPLNSIENPADFFLVADSVRKSLGVQGYSIPQGSDEWRVHLRHSEKANAVFADGHVSAMGRDYFAALHERQLYGGATNGQPFRLWPE